MPLLVAVESAKAFKRLLHALVRWPWRAACVWLAAQAVQAADLLPESLGVRLGLPVNHTGAGFKQVEGFSDWNLPWGWGLGKDWHLQSRLDLSLGWLADARVNSFVGTLGPTLVLGWRRFPLSLDGGVSPTVLSEYRFARKDIGCLFQFTSHLGVQWDILPHLRASYRFQHMSNAGLSADNPGLNMHVVGLSYVF